MTGRRIPVGRVALISLEPWDDVWRRNQYLATELVAQGLVDELIFVEPPSISQREISERVVLGITVIEPPLPLPKRVGGLRMAARVLRQRLQSVDVLWVNDPTLGVHCLGLARSAIYDVTDDWRTFPAPARIHRRIRRAEDKLAGRCRTVVCSSVLRDRWDARYGVEAALVHNGVDLESWAAATPRAYGGESPHVGYVGTLHQDRLDVPLLLRIATEPVVGTLHLVGPDSLDPSSRRALESSEKIVLHGPVPAPEVASWTKGLDLLITPHLVTPFTLSLDAIKSYEYLASGRPIVATPTSGFQHLAATPGVTVVESSGFKEAVRGQLLAPPAALTRTIEEMSWAARAREFAVQLSGAATIRRSA